MTSTNYLHYNIYIDKQETTMSKLQYLTQTRFGQPYDDVQDLSEEQKSDIIILKNLATAYMSTKDLTFREAVDLAHKDLPEDSIVESELGFAMEMAQNKSMDPMAIIEIVQEHVGH